jgi:hypothetical protein
VPGSRNLYDSSFRLQVNILVCSPASVCVCMCCYGPCILQVRACDQVVRLLSGMEVCAVAVQNSLERLFPDERTAAEEAAKKAQPNSKSSTGLLSSTMQSIGEDDGAGDSGEAVSTDEGKEVDSPGEEDVDELTTAALAGKLNVRDRLLVSVVACEGVGMFVRWLCTWFRSWVPSIPIMLKCCGPCRVNCSFLLLHPSRRHQLPSYDPIYRLMVLFLRCHQTVTGDLLTLTTRRRGRYRHLRAALQTQR